VPDLAVIGLVGRVDETAHGIRVQVVRIGILIEPFAGARDFASKDEIDLPIGESLGVRGIAALGRDDGPPVEASAKQRQYIVTPGRHLADLHRHHLGSEGVSAGGGHEAPGCARGPAVFVV